MNCFLKYSFHLNSIHVLLKHIRFAFLLFLAGLVINSSASAQSPEVSAKADTTQIRIGEQFRLHLYANIPRGIHAVFPLLPDTFNKFEIVTRGGIDTIASGDSTKRITLHQQFTLTSFDSGFFVLPPFPFTLTSGNGNSDTLSTEAILMTVKTVPVDTTRDIRTIKNVIGAPFPWKDYIIYLLIIYGITIVAMVIYTFLRKKEKIIIKPVIPLRPAHEIALEGLKRIDAEKIWQQGFTKRYYSELTDVIRIYIERRFSINAMEQTSDEIMRHFNETLLKEEEKQKLRFILFQADMVKFAKALPLPGENETAMTYANDFVNITRPVVKEDIKSEEKA